MSEESAELVDPVVLAAEDAEAAGETVGEEEAKPSLPPKSVESRAWINPRPFCISVREAIVPVSPFHWERDFWNAGYALVAGVDEVGRGALAGPLVAAAVIFDKAAIEKRSRRERIVACVKDSKLMTRQARETTLAIIESSAAAIGIGMVECHEIDALGMTAANRLVMERAVFGLELLPGALVAGRVRDRSGHAADRTDRWRCAVPFDRGCFDRSQGHPRSIDVLASSQDGRYGFDQHVGYGTPDHLRALAEYGPASISSPLVQAGSRMPEPPVGSRRTSALGTRAEATGGRSACNGVDFDWSNGIGDAPPASSTRSCGMVTNWCSSK